MKNQMEHPERYFTAEELKRGADQLARGLIGMLQEPHKDETTEPDKDPGITLGAGRFVYANRFFPLTGKPLKMLGALLESRYRRCRRNDLRTALEIDDEALSFPDQALHDTAKNLRATLRKALMKAGKHCDNPLPSTGKGDDLTYTLAMP